MSNNYYFLPGVQSVPLDIPIIKPDSMSLWKQVWNFKSTITKVVQNHNREGGLWQGFDIYRSKNYIQEGDIYKSALIECQDIFPKMFQTIFENIPVDIDCIRVAQSMAPFIPHRDHGIPKLATRTIIYENNLKPTFFYINNDGEKLYQRLPETTNTWMYDDQNYMHGSDLQPGRMKIMFLYYGTPNQEKLQKMLESSAEKFKDYIIR